MQTHLSLSRCRQIRPTKTPRRLECMQDVCAFIFAVSWLVLGAYPPELESALWHSLLDSSVFIFFVRHVVSCSLRLGNCAVRSVYTCFQLHSQAHLRRHPQARCSRLANLPVWFLYRSWDGRNRVSNVSTEPQLVAIIITEPHVVRRT